MNIVLAPTQRRPARAGRAEPADQAKGFTLIELMISVTIMAILLVVVAPGLAGFVRSGKVRSAQSELVSSLRLARSEATKRGVSVGVAATAPVVGDEFGAGWKVWVDDNEDGLLTAGETIVRDYPGFTGTVRLGVTAGAAPVLFRPTGFATAAVSFKVCGKNDTTKGYTVALQRVGMTDLTEGVACQ